MKDNLVYAHEKEVAALLALADTSNSDTPLLHLGVAFEWKDEQVFHVYAQHPRLPVSAYPIRAVFVCLPTNLSIENATTAYLKHLLNEEGIQANGRLLVCLFKAGKREVYKRAYLLDEVHDSTETCQLMYIPQRTALYSRSKGLLEVDILDKRTVSIIGIGSFGSNIAVELAKAGVGNFHLFDYDRLELCNISRHTSGVNDLGRYKTLAVRDAILQKNPHARVETHEINVNLEQELFTRLVSGSDLILCMTDENRSRNLINQVALELGITTIFAKAITRAEGGDVFRLRPRDPEAPCLACLMGRGLFSSTDEEVSTFKQADRDMPAYMGREVKDAVIQVGLSSDILPICNMVVKLALTELSRGLESGLTSLEEDLKPDYYIWANRRERKYRGLEPMGRVDRLSVLRWYGVNASRYDECISCQTSREKCYKIQDIEL